MAAADAGDCEPGKASGQDSRLHPEYASKWVSLAFEGVVVSERESETSVDRYDQVNLDEPFPDDEDDEPDLLGFTEEDHAALEKLPPEIDNLPPEANPDNRP